MKRNSSQLVFLLIAYAVTAVIWMRFIGPAERPKPPTPQEIAQVRKQAEQLLQQARTSGATLSRREREQRYQEALHRFDQVIRIDDKSETAIELQFVKADVLKEMAGANSGYLDQAEGLYKEIKKKYGHRPATITLDGKRQSVDVFEAANARLDEVLEQRDENSKPRILYRILDLLVAMTGRMPSFSYWFALFLLVIVIKGLLYPFSKRQFRSMADMQRVAPLIKEAQEKMKGRPAQEIQQRVMAIYRENNVSMTAGCLPALVQMAALFPLYYMIRFYEFQFRNGHFLWIGSSLSKEYHPYFAENLAAFDLPLFLLYLVSMILTSKMTPPPADPQQAQQQKIMMYMMPVMFGWIMYTAQWPAAFTFYWLVLNVVSTIQQYYILKHHAVVPAPAVSESGAGPGGNGRNGGGSDIRGSAKVAPRPQARRKRKR